MIRWIRMVMAVTVALTMVGCPSTGKRDRNSSPSAGAAVDAVPEDKPPTVTGFRCELSFERLSFMECNPTPSQLGFPECTTYEMRPVDSLADPLTPACVPGAMELSISGYPGRMDVLLVEAKKRSDSKSILLALKDFDSPQGWSVTRGAELGNLVFVGNRIEKLVFGAGLKSATGAESVSCPGPEQKEEDCQLRPE